MIHFGEQVTAFYASLDAAFTLPPTVMVMNPYRQFSTLQLTRIFYEKYFNDTHRRFFIFGINPGRHGGGITGIPFTDPLRLKNDCGIAHSLPLKPELSSQFIYKMINTYGGPDKFYSRFFLTAVCPLGFTMHGKNLNYYDSQALLKATRPFIISTIRQQVRAGANTEKCFCLGQGKNFEQLNAINNEVGVFKEIIALPHPRWVFQYKRKTLDFYIGEYIKAFREI